MVYGPSSFSSICSLLLKDLSFNFIILFAITAAGAVPCGSPRTPSIVQIIFSFSSFEISDDILRTKKILSGFNWCFSFAPDCQ